MSKTSRIAATGIVALAITGLAACHNGQPNMVQCTGVQTNSGEPFYTDKGTCEKLADSKPVPVKCDHWTLNGNQYVCDSTKLSVTHYVANDYVKCYGVAASAMNDCGTATTACGGTVTTAKAPGAWIAIPGGICQQIKGAVLKSNTDQG
jgi:hypothetical protein